MTGLLVEQAKRNRGVRELTINAPHHALFPLPLASPPLLPPVRRRLLIALGASAQRGGSVGCGSINSLGRRVSSTHGRHVQRREQEEAYGISPGQEQGRRPWRVPSPSKGEQTTAEPRLPPLTRLGH